MFSITKTFEFEASHKLNLDYESPCKKIHGHSYKVEITVESEGLDSNGMVIDFSELKDVKEKIMELWDHALIMSQFDPNIGTFRDLAATRGIIKLAELPQDNVTAEHMAKFIHNETYHCLREKGFNVRNMNIQVSIWETSNNKATYRA